MKFPFGGFLQGVTQELPRIGTAGSRSALLHADDPTAATPSSRFDFGPRDAQGVARGTIAQLRRFFILRWMGTIGSLFIAVGALGAGALPVVGNPYDNLPLGSLMSRMLQASSALVMLGVGMLVTAWVLMARFVGTPYRGNSGSRWVSTSQLWRTWVGWILPLVFTAPLFTQDIYSYLAQGSIVAQGTDPYAAGPVQLLGAENELARSVPFIWANSPSPYGPVALALAGLISIISSDTIVIGVLLHRVVSVLGVIAAGWALTHLAQRCRVSPAVALWLGVLNPLTILHLIGGIHNESIMLGLALVGVELGLRGISKLRADERWLPLLCASGALISCAGMVKVTGFIGLGFVGMALARALVEKKEQKAWVAIAVAALLHLAILVATIALVTLLTGIGLGWITGQGGAATIRSWLSVSTALGVASGFLGMLLGLGDHTDAMLTVTRTVGVTIAAAFMVRMLFATFRGSIHPIGGLGISSLVLVVLFPVVHPWYILWAVFPLAAWANRFIFRVAVVLYSGAMSFFVLPRGLGLPPLTVLAIYLAAIGSYLAVMGIWWVLLRRSGIRILD
ncbi:polyprenol phosphomannose-dependent alpha 1,6 mannosyltransferase MptB [Corynebacterium camporealensis]